MPHGTERTGQHGTATVNHRAISTKERHDRRNRSHRRRLGGKATDRFRESGKTSPRSTSQERVNPLASKLINAVNDTVLERTVTYEEYNALKTWLIKVGEDGEWPLFLDVWVEHSVEEVANQPPAGQQGHHRGPVLRPGPPEHEPPATIAMREDEPGTPLLFQGQVTLETAALAGAQIEIGTPTTWASTPSSHRACRNGTCAALHRRRPGQLPDPHHAAGAVPDPHGRRLRPADRRRRLACLAPGPPAPEGLGARATSCSPPSCTSRATRTTPTTSPPRSSRN